MKHDMLTDRLVPWLLRLQRWPVQLASTLITNSYFFSGTLKALPCWGFNCYACPIASFACPIGSLQHFITLRQVPFYVLGVIGLAGALWGRMACGWLCPFGFLQDMLYKIKVPKWPIHAGKTGKLRYVFFIVLVGIVPYLTLEPWFCKLCPAGMLEGGIPVVLTHANLREQIGGLYFLKFFLLLMFLAWMLVTKRPFCRYVCPLGAFWSPLNRFSIIRLDVNQALCISCGQCYQVCPVDISIYEDPNSDQCIRCLQCIKACSQNAIHIKTSEGKRS